MTIRFEDKIRDYLASNLELLERGMTLLKKEYAIRTPLGASGRIDILAKDVYGHFVVIEIKRSDQAAREALHEIHKYIAIFRNSQGLDELRIRLIVVSTAWNELRLPLSEFAETTAYSVDAISITAQQDGTITQFSKVDLLNRVSALSISRVQCLYLYETAEKRDKHLDLLTNEVLKVGIQDFAIFRCDYAGGNHSVVFPHGYYLCFSSPILHLSSTELDKLKAQFEWDEGLDEPDENFVCQMEVGLCDSFEIGYPEKLTNLRAQWSVSVIKRLGRLDREQSLLTDDEILSLAQAVHGGGSIYMIKTSSPRFEASWKQLRTNVDGVLEGNNRWQKTVSRFLNEVERLTPNATVSVYIYNPANIYMALYFISWNDDYSKCPRLEIVVEDNAGGTVTVLMGFLVWTRRHIQVSPADLINKIFQDDFTWIAAVAMHGTFEDEDASLSAHHLAPVIVEWRFKAEQAFGPTQISVQGKKLLRRRFPEQKYRPLTEFVRAHSEYLAALNEYVKERMCGLPGTVGFE